MRSASRWTWGLATAVAVMLLVVIIPADANDFLFPLTYTARTIYGLLAVVVALGLARGGSTAARRLTMGAAAMLVVAAGVDTYQWRRGLVWPPRPEHSRSHDLTRLTSAEGARWAARVAAHAYSIGAMDGRLSVPDEWPLPPGSTLALRERADSSVEVWAHWQGARHCVTLPRKNGPTATARSTACDTTATPAGAAFANPERQPAVPGVVQAVVPAGAWPQYRYDAAKSGHAKNVAGSPWISSIPGPMRATVSVVGPYVVAGSHDTGVLAAFRSDSGQLIWHATLPNWVHQDPVSDGVVVVAGFGDNDGSFDGGAPSGVAAFELATGTHLWTVFDESSVMTSPVVMDSVIVYISTSGVLRKRLLRTGALLATMNLPGGAPMAPPAAIGDTIAVSLDRNLACAVLVQSFTKLWCRQVRGMRQAGHAAPTIVNGAVMISGGIVLQGLTAAEFARLPWGRRIDLAVGAFRWDHTYVGQRFVAMRLADGERLWWSRLYATTREVEGHLSGTVAARGDQGFIVLPISDSLVAFDLATGRERWTAGALSSRGAPLVVGDRVIVAGRDGRIEVRDADSGEVRCVMQRPIGFDRAGGVLAGDAVIVAGLDGGIESMPTAALRECT